MWNITWINGYAKKNAYYTALKKTIKSRKIGRPSNTITFITIILRIHIICFSFFILCFYYMISDHPKPYKILLKAGTTKRRRDKWYKDDFSYRLFFCVILFKLLIFTFNIMLSYYPYHFIVKSNADSGYIKMTFSAKTQFGLSWLLFANEMIIIIKLYILCVGRYECRLIFIVFLYLLRKIIIRIVKEVQIKT